MPLHRMATIATVILSVAVPSGAPTGGGKCFRRLDATRTYSRRMSARSSGATYTRPTRTEPPCAEKSSKE